MPQPAKGARLWFNKGRGLWYIRDGASKRGTGCGLADIAGAEKALADYIGSRYTPPKSGSSSALIVSDVLLYYSREIIPGLRSKSAGYAVAAMLDWWGSRPLSDVKRSTCQAYVKHRTAQPIGQARTAEARKQTVSTETARRELAILRAAINAYHAETPLDALPVVTLPEASAPRTRWLTRSEAARLLRAAHGLEDREAGRALVRFILLGLYTGTRSGAIRRLGWTPAAEGGWVDLEAGVLHRRGEEELEGRKRRPPVRIPPRLRHFLERWRRADCAAGLPWLIHYRGRAVLKQRRSWAEACRVAKLGADVTPHILRHTAVTWMMRSGSEAWDVANYVGMGVQMLEDVYGHHHPDFQVGVAARIGRRR